MPHDPNETEVLPDAPARSDGGGGGAEVATQPARPTRLALPGRYDDLGPIGSGSFGEVRRVRDTLLDRVVAMKLLHVDHAERDHVRRRFLVEAQITAQLQHPGIVSVHDRGELPDGRLWFTMEEVRGRTLRDVLDELHAAKGPAGFGATPSGWTFRRAVDAFARIAQAMAYAHRRGVVHRDLKPENLMVGELGEVLVMDWGLARRVGAEDAAGPERAEPPAAPRSPGMTRHGDVLGTPAFMAPEQARGETVRQGPASDVYALGGVLHYVLTGQPPHRGALPEVLAALVADRPVAVSEAAAGGPPLPAELVAVCERALRPEIEARYESAEALAAEVVDWLDGVRRREQALAALDGARSLAPEIAALRARAADAAARARAMLGEVKSFDPIERKRPAWLLEDEAARLGRAAALAESRWMEAVQGALNLDPDLSEGHALLAEHHRAQLEEAELSRREDDAARAEAMLRLHDRGRHAAFLRGAGALTLVTDPPGVEVHVERFVMHDRRLVPVPEGALGVTPLVEAPLQRGSYLLRLRAPGRAEVLYPVLIERAGHWDGRAPGEAAPHPIVVPEVSELGPDDRYVPAGWCWTGGDAATTDSLPRRRIWIDGFVIRRFPVTAAEYLEYLNDLVVAGREAAAIEACPRPHQALSPAGDEPALPRDGAGRYGLPPDREGLRWRLDGPVVLVDWHQATAYVRWLAERTGRAWRLPDELEHEKAARGVDGRLLPWSDHIEPTFACVADASAAEPSGESVYGHPFDESPYGVRGLAGNVRDWCINTWRHEGSLVEDDRLVIDAAAADDPDFRVLKGGSWSSPLLPSRAAARFGGRPSIRRPVVGFRIARSLTAARDTRA
jgi:serine/threonine-protein kinase